VPEALSSDGGPEFTASATVDFLHRWGIRHRISSAYHPQSNGRAEVAVKTAKRLLRANTSALGTLDSDRFLRTMLQLRNTPDPDCGMSPAEIVFGRNIRDSLAFVNRLEKFTNPHIRPTWREAWAAKESALKSRFTRSADSLNEHARQLKPLHVGDTCYIQNQTGNSPRRWDKTGIVVETLDHDKYAVKVDGSGRVTMRNRRFLRKFLAIDSQRQPQQLLTRTDVMTTPLIAATPVPPLTPQQLPPKQSIQLPHQQETPKVPSSTPQTPSTAPPQSLSAEQPDSPPTLTELAPPIRRSTRDTRRPRTYDAASGRWV